MDLSANHKGPYFSITNPVTGEIFHPPEGRYWVFNEEEVKNGLQMAGLYLVRQEQQDPFRKFLPLSGFTGKSGQNPGGTNME